MSFQPTHHGLWLVLLTLMACTAGESRGGKKPGTEKKTLGGNFDQQVVVQDRKISVTPLDAPNTESVEVEWSDEVDVVEDTVVVIEQTKAGDDSNVVTAAWQKGATPPPENSVVLIKNTGIFRVDAIDESKSQPRLKLKPVPFHQAVKNAKIRFDRKVSLAEEGTLSLQDPKPVEGEFDFGPITIGTKATISEEQAKIEAKGPFNKGIAFGSVNAFIELTNMRVAGNIDIVEGELTDFRLTFGHVNIKGGVGLELTVGVDIPEGPLEVPLKVEIPFTVGVVPAKLTIGTALALTARQSPNGSLKILADFALAGATEFLDDGEQTASVDRDQTHSTELQEQEVVETVFQFGLTIPSIGVKFGNILASTGFTFNNAVEFGQGVTFVAGAEGPTRDNSCLLLNATMASAVVGEVGFLGLKFQHEKEIWQDSAEFLREGGLCDRLVK